MKEKNNEITSISEEEFARLFHGGYVGRNPQEVISYEVGKETRRSKVFELGKEAGEKGKWVTTTGIVKSIEVIIHWKKYDENQPYQREVIDPQYGKVMVNYFKEVDDGVTRDFPKIVIFNP